MLQLFLVMLTLDASSGAEVAPRVIEGGPYASVAECVELTLGTPANTAKDGKVVVHECATKQQLGVE